MKVLLIGHAYAAAYNRVDKLARIAQHPEVASLDVLIPAHWVDRMLKTERKYEAIPEDELYTVHPLVTFLNGSQQKHFYSPVVLHQIVNEVNPDVIHLEQEPHDWVSSEIMLLNHLLWHKPVVMFTWENLVRDYDFLTQWSRPRVVQSVDYVIGGNSEAIKILQSHEDYTGPSRVIPQFGVDQERFKPLNVDELRQQLKVENCFTIGFVGRYVEEKGIHTLLSAIERLIEANKDQPFTLLLLSSMEPPSWLQEKLASLKEHVVVISSVPHEDFPRYMNVFDVLVLPSETQSDWKEQFGRVMIEAMACKVAVVGSSSGAIPDVIDDETMVFPEKNKQALAEILQRLMNDSGLLSQKKERAYQRALAEYTHDRIVEKTVGVWNEMTRNDE